MKKRYIYLLIAFIFLFLTVLSILKLNEIYDEGHSNVMWFAIYPGGTMDYTYYFILNTDRILTVSKGERNEDTDISHVDFMKKIKKTGHTKLNKKVYEKLINLANEVNINKVKKLQGTICDGDTCTLYYNKSVYNMVYYKQSVSFSELRKELIHLSPIDFHE